MENLGLQEQFKLNEEPSERRNPVPRRPRMKEVSSRFMSPVSSLSSSSVDPTPKCPLPKPSMSTELYSMRSQCAQRRNPNSHMTMSSDTHNSEPESICSADENRIENMVRSLDEPLRSTANVVHMSNENPVVFQPKVNSQKKRVEKLLKENGEQLNYPMFPDRGILKNKKSGNRIFSRPDTPTVMSRDYKTPKLLGSQNMQRSINSGVSSAANTVAARLVMSSGLAAKRTGSQEIGFNHGNSTVTGEASDSATIEARSAEISNESLISTDGCDTQTSIISSSQGGLCDSQTSIIPVQSIKTRHISDFQSSMPVADTLHTVSSRFMGDQNSGAGNKVDDSCRVSAASPCHRSLNSALSNCQESFSPTKSISKSTVLSKINPNLKKTNGFCSPPHPSNLKIGPNNNISSPIKPVADAKRGTKASNHQEDIHSMRILYNRYLQWRFANAKAESAMNAQKTIAERSLYGLSTKLSELQSSATRKRMDLARLKMEGNLYDILEGQMPHLDEWTHLEGTYSSSLPEVIKALQDATLRLPVTGNVRADCRELGEALNSAADVLEGISPHVGMFLPKAEKTNSMFSALAGVVSTERALVEECGDLLAKAQMLQIKESSLRAQLIQVKSSSYEQPKGY